MSNPGPVEHHQQMPARGGLPTQVPAVKAAPPVAVAPTTAPPVNQDNWDTIVAAIHAISSMGQPILLTLTAQNMKPIWIDFHTRRFYMEALMHDIPATPIGVKVFSHPVDPNDPPYPWVAWKSLDALLWNIGDRAFTTGRAIWLILGERYTLSRWPNLTEIAYGVDDLRSISMLANGMITIDELALVSRTSIEHSQKLISMLSLLGVLRGTGAPMVPAQLMDAAADVELEVQLREAPLEPVVAHQEIPSFAQEEALPPFEEYAAPVQEYEYAAPVEEQYNPPVEQFPYDDLAVADPPLLDPIEDELPSLSDEELNLPAYAPTIEQPEDYTPLPPEAYRGHQAMVSGPSFFETPLDEEVPVEKSSPVQNPAFEAQRPIAQVKEFPSFSEIMQAQAQASSEVKEEEEEAKPTGLFGLLRKKLGKK